MGLLARKFAGRREVGILGGVRRVGARMFLRTVLPFQCLLNQLVLDFVVVLVKLPDDVLDDERIGITNLCDRIFAKCVKRLEKLVVFGDDLVELSRKNGEGDDFCGTMSRGKDGGHCSC